MAPLTERQARRILLPPPWALLIHHSPQVTIVQTTWTTALSLGKETVGILLFKHIFDLAPQAIELFPFRFDDDLEHSPMLKTHAIGVVNTVSVAVGLLRDLGKLVPILEDLGARHIGYGVAAEHYPIVGKALLMTLEAGLGDAFTIDVKNAWSSVWDIVANTMMSDFYEDD